EECIDMKNELWGNLFNLEKKVFKSRSGLCFDGSITTDGVSVSIYLKHPDAGRYTSKSNKKKSKKGQEEERKLCILKIIWKTVENPQILLSSILTKGIYCFVKIPL